VWRRRSDRFNSTLPLFATTSSFKPVLLFIVELTESVTVLPSAFGARATFSSPLLPHVQPWWHLENPRHQFVVHAIGWPWIRHLVLRHRITDSRHERLRTNIFLAKESLIYCKECSTRPAYSLRMVQSERATICREQN
jgi:hypothetical protein